jgi:MFS superfamily sulfate permease-like transporter
MKKYFLNAGKDIPASIVVFLVALPLCLGVAQASNPSGLSIVPLLGGIVAGVIGGIVIGSFSGSQLSVSGPAAGLTAVVGAALVTLGGVSQSYEAFLMAVVLAGLLQVIMGFVKAGVIGDYIPNSVIKGMLAAIGIILILKQFPHLVGEDMDPEGDESFVQPNKKKHFHSHLLCHQVHDTICFDYWAGRHWYYDAMGNKTLQKSKAFQVIPGALIVVVVGTVINELYKVYSPSSVLDGKHLVVLPSSQSELFSSFRFPNFSSLGDYHVWMIAVTIAIVASLEHCSALKLLTNLIH